MTQTFTKNIVKQADRVLFDSKNPGKKQIFPMLLSKTGEDLLRKEQFFADSDTVFPKKRRVWHGPCFIKL